MMSKGCVPGIQRQVHFLVTLTDRQAMPSLQPRSSSELGKARTRVLGRLFHG